MGEICFELTITARDNDGLSCKVSWDVMGSEVVKDERGGRNRRCQCRFLLS